MPYNKGGRPQIEDRVRHLTGKIGTVTYIDAKGENAGRDIVAVRFDDGSVPKGMLPAARYTLIAETALKPDGSGKSKLDKANSGLSLQSITVNP